MNWIQFKDPVSSVCLAGTVVVYWSLTQEMASSSPFTVITNIFVTEFVLNLLNSVKHLGKTNLSVILDYLHNKILDTPPLDPIFLIFMQFSANFGHIIG